MTVRYDMLSTHGVTERNGHLVSAPADYSKSGSTFWLPNLGTSPFFGATVVGKTAAGLAVHAPGRAGEPDPAGIDRITADLGWRPG